MKEIGESQLFEYKLLNGMGKEIEEVLNEWGNKGWKVVWFSWDEGYWNALIEKGS